MTEEDFEFGTSECKQCGVEAYYEFNKHTKESQSVCTNCGRVEKRIIKEDIKMTEAALQEVKEYYDAGEYANALYYIGYPKEVVDGNPDWEIKRQVERELKNPTRYALLYADSSRQTMYYIYETIVKPGYGSYSIKHATGEQEIGVFHSAKHRNYVTSKICNEFDLYSETETIEIKGSDGTKSVWAVI